MIPLLTDDVDVVTASPYHPRGQVKNVPRWRLFLSKGLSRLYRLVLRQKLHTYTSCFRVYRRQAAVGIAVERGGFFGVTEMLGPARPGGASHRRVPGDARGPHAGPLQDEGAADHRRTSQSARPAGSAPASAAVGPPTSPLPRAGP